LRVIVRLSIGESILLQGVEHWFLSLEIDKMTAVTGAIDLLEMEGPMLGRQVVDRG
jgi:hypothetical protein